MYLVTKIFSSVTKEQLYFVSNHFIKSVKYSSYRLEYYDLEKGEYFTKSSCNSWLEEHLDEVIGATDWGIYVITLQQYQLGQVLTLKSAIELPTSGEFANLNSLDENFLYVIFLRNTGTRKNTIMAIIEDALLSYPDDIMLKIESSELIITVTRGSTWYDLIYTVSDMGFITKLMLLGGKDGK